MNITGVSAFLQLVPANKKEARVCFLLDPLLLLRQLVFSNRRSDARQEKWGV